jgi:DNA-binding response OmpR family regulator
MDVHIAALRRKLARAGAWIHTVRGVGYAFRSPESVPNDT